MNDNVINLHAPEKTPEDLLEDCKPIFKDFILIGWNHNGDLQAAVTKEFADIGNILFVMEVFKNAVMAGVYSE